MKKGSEKFARKIARRTALFPRTKVALAVRRQQETVAELSRRQKVHANQIYKWKLQLPENVSACFRDRRGGRRRCHRCARLELLQKIGEMIDGVAIFYHTGSVDCDDAPCGSSVEPAAPLSMRWSVQDDLA